MAQVLLVDDNPEIRLLAGMFIRRGGHTVLAAENGERALEVLDAGHRPDLAVLDVAMPGMTGLELLERLRARQGMADLPAVFVSARSMPEDIARGRSLGAAYLTKPFVGQQLLSVMDQLLAA